MAEKQETVTEPYLRQKWRVIPNLRFREMLAFGKALQSERPVVVSRPYDEVKLQASRALDVMLAGSEISNVASEA